ncbi:hypothetical protein Tco_1192807 [Tanacetum coccineum]
MVTEMVFNGTSSSTPSRSTLLPTAAPNEVNAPVEGRNLLKRFNLKNPKKLKYQSKASRKVHQDPDAHVLLDYMIDGKMVQITGDELQYILDKKEQMERAAKNAELSKDELMKVAAEIVNEVGVKVSDNKHFLNIQDVNLKEHN